MSSEMSEGSTESSFEETIQGASDLKDVRWYRGSEGVDLAVLSRRGDSEGEMIVGAGEGKARAAVIGVFCRVADTEFSLVPDATEPKRLAGEFGKTGHGSCVVVDSGSGASKQGTHFERMIKDLVVLCRAIGGTPWEGRGVPGLVEIDEGGARLKLMHRFFVVGDFF